MAFSKQISKSGNIDFVKYIAAIMVIVGHSFVLASKNLSAIASFLKNHIAFGPIGVAIFFFLSGFLVTRSMIQKKTAREYFRVRVYKIIPPLFVVILVTAFVLGPCVTTLPIKEYFSTSGTYKYLLNIVLIRQHFLPGVFEDNPYPRAVNGSVWTLLFEFLCYIATYVAYKLKLLRKGAILIPIPAVIIGVIVLFAVASKFRISYGYLSTIVRPCICYYMGMILFFYYEYLINSKIFTVSVVLSFIGILTHSSDVFLIFVIPILLLNIGWGLSVSVKPRLANLGKYSYGIYLVAFPIQQLLVYIWEDMTPLVNSIVTINLSTFLGKLIYEYIELPMNSKLIEYTKYCQTSHGEYNNKEEA